MKRPFLLLISLLAGIAATAQSAESMYALFGHMEGVWMYKKGEKMVFEEWHFINDSTLEGKGYRVNGSDTTVTEKLTLRRRGGIIQYAPVAFGQNNDLPVEFKGISFTTTKEGVSGREAHNQVLAVFGNPLHDSPKYIRYSIRKDEMIVLVGDDAAMSSNRLEFYFDKVE
jgi:hypothetical protein